MNSFRLSLFLLIVFCCTSTKSIAASFKTVKVADGVYAFIPPGPLHDIVEGNSVAIIGDDAVLVVDTFGDSYTANQMIAGLKELTPKPVRYIVNTHWHYDHVMGNYVWKKAFPDAIIIGHARMRELYDVRIPKIVGEEPKASYELKSLIRRQLESGRNEEGTPLTKYEREVRLPQTLADLDTFVSYLDEYKYQPLDVTINDSLTVYLGKNRTIQIFHPGKAHSSGDLFVHIASARILITGDVVVSPVPYAFGAFHTDWLRVLNKIIWMKPAKIIPGHGEVQSDLKYVRSMIDLLTGLQEIVTAAYKDTLSLEQAQSTIDLPALRTRFAGKDDEKNWAFTNYFLKPGIKSLYNEFKKIPKNN
ncbi:MAG: MBL fold metallo-hydrolase [bacterium]